MYIQIDWLHFHFLSKATACHLALEPFIIIAYICKRSIVTLHYIYLIHLWFYYVINNKGCNLRNIIRTFKTRVPRVSFLGHLDIRIKRVLHSNWPTQETFTNQIAERSPLSKLTRGPQVGCRSNCVSKELDFYR